MGAHMKICGKIKGHDYELSVGPDWNVSHDDPLLALVIRGSPAFSTISECEIVLHTYDADLFRNLAKDLIRAADFADGMKTLS